MSRIASVGSLRDFRKKKGVETPEQEAARLRRVINTAEKDGQFGHGFLAYDDPEVERRREERRSLAVQDEDEPRELTEIFIR